MVLVRGGTNSFGAVLTTGIVQMLCNIVYRQGNGQAYEDASDEPAYVMSPFLYRDSLSSIAVSTMASSDKQ